MCSNAEGQKGDEWEMTTGMTRLMYPEIPGPQLYWRVLCSILSLCAFSTPVQYDHNGYILYCPCMGRFGNQADHFLGAFAFAHALKRTLVLPPWVEYERGNPRSVQIPFDTYFDVNSLREYHRVVTMETFMEKIAPEIWPPGNRTVFCHSSRGNGGCNAKDGNPFGPFWDTFNIDFDHSEFYSPLSHHSASPFEMDKWRNKYPPEEHLVMAFVGAPATFPVTPADAKLHRYLHWSVNIDSKAELFIKENIVRPYIGIHLRNGIDWTNACSHAESTPQMFASTQCLGIRGEFGRVTPELCFPSDKIIIKQLKAAIKKYSAKTVFIATDSRDMIPELEKAFKKVKFLKHKPPHPHMDLAILGKSDFFIGNCVSTYTAFAKRERDAEDKPSGFWAFPLKKTNTSKEEL